MPKLSVVIPSWKDPLLHKTIDSLLDNSKEDIEVIPVLDGYWPDTPIKEDKRIKVVHLGKNRGMRGAINAGVLASRGEYVMRTDEHCSFGHAFDRKLLAQIEDNWIVTPRRYFLDPTIWRRMDIKPVDYAKLKIVNYSRGQKFSGVDWPERTEEHKDVMIDETMAMQGSCWIMKRSWWDKVIGELEDYGYGTHYQDSHEMVFKTWQAGGKLMVNKTTWHAHKHRKFPRTHGYGGALADACFKYSLDKWREYYEKEIKPKWKI